MTHDEIVDLLEELVGAYPYYASKIIDAEDTIKRWEREFGEYEAGYIYKAARTHENTSRYFPSIEEIKRLINKGQMLYGEDQPTQNNSNLVANTPTAPHKLISPDVTFCDLCELCDKHDQRLCDY